MLNIQNLNFSFETNLVLDDLELELEPNAIHGIVGLNGSGKTTLLNLIYGSIKSRKGKIFWKGEPMSRDQIAYLETENFFYSRITGQEYLQLFRHKNPDFNFDDWNGLFNLPLGHLIETYSTGMKKKLAFLGVLSFNRPLLLLDEPFNGVDMETNASLHQILAKLPEKGRTIIVTSHIMESLTNLCDKIHFLRNGKIEGTYKKAEFQNLIGQMARHRSGEINSLINNLKELE